MEGTSWSAYLALSAANKAPFSAFVRLPRSAILSLSPERFLLLDGRHIETKPIKGTRPRHPDPAIDKQVAESLASADKDRSENLMIVDLLRNDIGRVSRPGSVSVPSLFAVESFPAVHHLVSTIHGELDARWQGVDLLRACFPGGSITGAATDPGDGDHRGAGAGAPKRLLRQHRLSEPARPDGHQHLHSHPDSRSRPAPLLGGGGIIADSDPDAEYQETYDKVARILPLLDALRQSSL